MFCSRENHIVDHPSNLWCTYHDDWFTPPQPHVDTYLILFNAGYMMMRMPTFYMDPTKNVRKQRLRKSFIFGWRGIQQVVFSDCMTSDTILKMQSMLWVSICLNHIAAYPLWIIAWSHPIPMTFLLVLSILPNVGLRNAPESSATPGHLQQCAAG